ncbi:MAG: phosphogluconate dehydrogenase (NAD(+)-dependent, decarboxylating) [Acidimicrobiales bacterium]
MQIGIIGLGRMGANLTRRLIRAGHQVVAYDVSADAVAQLASEGATGASSLDAFVDCLELPRVAWIMVPAAFAGDMVEQVAARFSAQDIIIDGGNSYYVDDLARAQQLRTQGIHYVDVGTSGGVFGLERGFCLMIGGDLEPVQRLDPIFAALAPGFDAAERTPNRTGERTTAELGYLHCGPPGAGHFVKMVHNGIEYGLMAAYAEGFNILAKANVGKLEQSHDAETTPLRDPERYQYDLDLPAVAEVWRRGSVVASWLLDLTANALAENADLEGFSGRVSDSGEGRWTMLAAVEEGAPAHVLGAALFNRFASRGEADYADRLLSAMRQQFGGHAESPKA